MNPSDRVLNLRTAMSASLLQPDDKRDHPYTIGRAIIVGSLHGKYMITGRVRARLYYYVPPAIIVLGDIRKSSSNISALDVDTRAFDRVPVYVKANLFYAHIG